jgi:hypothetical protein
VEIEHEEMITPLLSATDTGAYRCFTAKMNPANPLLRWLSASSVVYDQYRFSRLSAHYIPTVPATTEGNVVLAFDVDAMDPPPASLSDHMQLTGAAMAPVWSGVDCHATYNNTQNWYYTNDLETVGRTTEQGQLFAALDNVVASDKSQGFLVLPYRVQFKTAELIHRDIAARETFTVVADRTGSVSNPFVLSTEKSITAAALSDTSKSANMPIFTSVGVGESGDASTDFSSVDVFPGSWIIDVSTTSLSEVWQTGLYDYAFDVLDGLTQSAANAGDFTITKFNEATSHPTGTGSSTFDGLTQQFHIEAKKAVKLLPWIRTISSGLGAGFVGGVGGVRVSRFLESVGLGAPERSPLAGVGTIPIPALFDKTKPTGPYKQYWPIVRKSKKIDDW